MAEPAEGLHSFLVCFAGPDVGKRATLAGSRVRLGTAADAEILSDDPDVLPNHVVLTPDSGRVRVDPVDSALVFLDAQRLTGPSTMAPGQQLRLGRSFWRIEDDEHAAAGLGSMIRGLGDRVSTVAGLDTIQGFSFKDMFSEVFKRRTDEEIEEYFIAGTRLTTPPLSAVDTSWPKPWAFARVFAFSLAAYVLLSWGLNYFNNDLFIPGIIFIGSVAFPFAILIFFYEMNVVRNVSVPALLRFVVFGGIFSLLSSLVFYQLSDSLTGWLGAMSAGIVEEAGKAAVLLLFVRQKRYPWILNGLLIGAAVGTGFSIFETAGYVLMQGLEPNGIQGMFHVIVDRGWLNVLGDHSLWTGLVGAALWRVRGNREFSLDMLVDPRFLRVLALSMVLHMVNNSPFELPMYGKYFAIGFVAWVVLFSFIQAGLHQVRDAQVHAETPQVTASA
jgi:protease PrsW